MNHYLKEDRMKQKGLVKGIHTNQNSQMDDGQ
jgi:hypothetical protein